jgi:predicted nucleotidyltransferase
MYNFRENDFKEIKNAVQGVLKGFPDIYLATVFGSAVKNKLKPGSDIDIAVAGLEPLGFDRKTQLYLALSKVFQQNVDLVDLHQLDGEILKNALCTGEIVIKRSTNLLAEILKKLWYNQADMMPHRTMIMEKQIQRFIHGKTNNS